MKLLFIILTLLGWGDISIPNQKNTKQETKLLRSLNTEEARAIVLVYQSKVRYAKVELKQEILIRDYYQHRLEHMTSFLKSHLVTQKEYEEIELKFKLAVLDVEHQEVEIEEAERNLKLAEIRAEIEYIKEKAPSGPEPINNRINPLAH